MASHILDKSSVSLRLWSSQSPGRIAPPQFIAVASGEKVELDFGRTATLDMHIK
jgi:hypothetical protein